MRSVLFDKFHTETYTALFVHFQHFHLYRVTLRELVADIGDALLADLRDVHQPILAGQYGDEGAKIHDFRNPATVNLADCNVGGNHLDPASGLFAGSPVDGSDLDQAAVVDVDARASLLGDPADRGAALADHFANLFRIDAHGDETRRVGRHFRTRRRDRFLHLAQ